MNAIGVLKSAKQLISNPENWTKGSYARDKDGKISSVIDGAVSWCATGALFKVVASKLACDKAFRLLSAVVPDGNYLTLYNDAPERTHEEIMALFDRAIELAENET